MNPFRRMVTVGHNARVFVWNRRPTEREETAKRRQEGDMWRDVWSWCQARSNPPPGCLWWLWRSASTLTEPFRPDGNVFCWWLSSITNASAAFIGKRDSNTVTAPFREWVSMERQHRLALHLGYLIFRSVAGIHSSDIGSLYREKLQQHSPWPMLGMSVNGASTIFSVESWVIYVPNGYRHPFIKYWQPLLANTTATCSLLHPQNERQRRVNSFSCCIFGDQGIPWIFTFITESLTALIGRNTIHEK